MPEPVSGATLASKTTAALGSLAARRAKELWAEENEVARLLRALGVRVRRDAAVPHEIRESLAKSVAKKLATDPDSNRALMLLLEGQRFTEAMEVLGDSVTHLTQDAVQWPADFGPRDFGKVVARHAAEATIEVKANERGAAHVDARRTQERLDDVAMDLRRGFGDTLREITGARYASLEDLLDAECRARSQADHELIGREWLLAQLDELPRSRRAGYVWLEAEAGLGKTAIAEAVAARYSAPAYFFSHSAGRRRAERCLEHLAAELILRQELDYGHLPADAGEDAGFLASVLAEAVAVRSPLWLVVDALDEAERLASGVALPLPEQLPAGVFVLLTSCPGRFGPRVRPGGGTSIEMVRLTPDDERQQQDVAAFLEQRAGSLASREQGRSAHDELLQQLAERSEGNFMYLAFVLDDLAVNPPSGTPLQALPRGLEGYYRVMWEEIAAAAGRDWEVWEQLLLPVVERVAVAGEPVTLEWIADHVGRSGGEIRTRALEVWRRFLRRSGEDRDRWTIVHQSFRDFLAGSEHVDVVAAHDAVADLYVASPERWNEHEGYALRQLSCHLVAAGRTDELLRLVEDPRWRAAQLRYDPSGASYLSDVMDAWNALSEINAAAVAEDEPPPSLSEEISCALLAAQMHSRFGYLGAGLLERSVGAGLWTAGQAVAAARRNPDATQRALALGRLAPLLREGECQEALVEALTMTPVLPELAAELPEDLLDEVFVAAREAMHDPETRVKAMRALAERWTGGQAAAALEEARRAAGEIREPSKRSETLRRLAPSLPPEGRQEAYAAALAAIWEIGAPSRKWELERLAGAELPQELLAQAVATAQALPDDGERREALAALLKHLPERLRGSVLPSVMAAAVELGDARDRAAALNELLAYLPAKELGATLQMALLAAAEVTDTRRYVDLLADLARYLPPGWSAPLLDDAMNEIVRIEGPLDRALAFRHVSRGLRGKKRILALERSAEALGEVADLDFRIGFMSQEMLKVLPAGARERLLSETVRAASEMRNPALRALRLAQVSGVLPPERRASVLEQALSAAGEVREPTRRMEAFEGVADALAATRRAQALKGAVLAAGEIADPAARMSALHKLSSELSGRHRKRALADALAAAIAIAKPAQCVQALNELAPDLPEDLVGEALAALDALPAASARARIFNELAVHLRGKQRIGARREALAAIEAVADPAVRAETLNELAGSVRGALRQKLVDRALAAAHEIHNPADRAEMLGEIGCDLRGEQRDEIIAQALAATREIKINRRVISSREIKNRIERVRALGMIARYLPRRLRDPIVAEALSAYDELDPLSQLRLLLPIGTYLSHEQRARVTRKAFALFERGGAGSTTDTWLEAMALEESISRATVAPSRQVLDRALELSERPELQFMRVNLRRSVLAHLDGARRERAVREELSAAMNVTNAASWQRLELALLMPYLSDRLCLQTFEQAFAIEDPYVRASVFATLAPRLPEEQRSVARSEALSATQRVPWERRATVLAMFADELAASPVSAHALWVAVLRTGAQRGDDGLARLAAALGPALEHLLPAKPRRAVPRRSAPSAEGASRPGSGR